MRKDNPKIFLIAYIVVVLVIGAIFIALFVGRCATRGVLEEKEAITTVYVADEVFSDLMDGDKSELLDLNGSSVELLNEAAAFVNTYLNALSEGDYEKAYGMYATEVVSKKGYTYTFEKFCENSDAFLEKVGVEKGASSLTAHYNGCVQNEYYVSVSIIIGRKANGEYYSPVAAEYTLIKAKDGYKLLDFSYIDFDLYSYKFGETNGVGLPQLERFTDE